MRTGLLALMLLVGVAPALAAPSKPESVPQISLTKLLANRFGNLSLAEKRLAAAAGIGETADCTNLSENDKVIRGTLLSWLCTNVQATANLTYHGVLISNANIVGDLDLRWAKISFPLVASDSVFEGIALSNSHIVFLSLTGSILTNLTASAISQ